MAETYQIAGRFSSGTEYRWFKEKYCENGCVYHKENERGYAEYVKNGGCPIEDRIEHAMFDKREFPNVLVSVRGDDFMEFNRCVFYRRDDDG